MPFSVMNRIGPYGVPFEWTEYAQGIADHYQNIVPWFMSVPTGMTGATLEHRIVVTSPYQHDVLIFAAHIDGCIGATDSDVDTVITEDGDTVITEDGDTVVTEGGEGPAGNCDGDRLFLQVQDQGSLLTWATSNPINSAPLSAYGGARNNPTSLYKLPDAFFLPAGTGLRHDFRSFADTTSGGMITWVGVQLINPWQKNTAPKQVTVRGEQVGVGSRIPWLGVIGLGRKQFTGGTTQFQLNSGRRFLAYTQAAECDIEIHDIHAQFFMSLEDSGGDPDNIQFELSDTGERKLWSQSFAPAPSLMGDPTKVFPALPLTKPYLLKRGRQLELTMANNGNVATLNGFVIARGVKLCGF